MASTECDDLTGSVTGQSAKESPDVKNQHDKKSKFMARTLKSKVNDKVEPQSKEVKDS